MPKCLLVIGSNYNRNENMLLARHELNSLFSAIYFSNEQETKPIDFNHPALFSNQVAIGHTELILNALTAKLKAIEILSGRQAGDKQEGKVCLDIDLLLYDQIKFKADDWSRDYVISGIKELKTKIKI